MHEQRLGTILWRGKWLVLVSVAVGIGLALLATKTSAKVYQASAKIQVNTGNGGGAAALNPAEVQLANQNLASTYATLITDRGFLNKIKSDVYGGQLGTSELSSRLSAKAITATSLVELTAQGPSPASARRLAADVVREFLASVRSQADSETTQLQNQIQIRISALTAQIRRLRANPANADEVTSLAGARAELVRQLAAITANQIAAGNSVQVTAPPTGPSSPVKPRPVLNLIAGILLGLLVGFFLAWLRVRLDRKLHSAEEAEQLLGVPTLSAIPVRRRFSVEDPVLGEAYDVLRANLAFLSADQDLHVLTFSSFNPREGKSSTVEGLAYAAVRGGLNVLVIDGDVRTRALSARLGHADAPGLTNAIVGMGGDVESAVIELSPGLSLLPSGPMPPNPPSLLSSGRMRDLVSELRARHSLILIDSPPVAHLADASILASMSDGVVVVARVGITNRADLRAAVANLRQVPTPIVGAVLLQQRQIDETYYPAVSQGRRPLPTAGEPKQRPDAVETF